MATVQSLGQHEPSALAYLVAEGILPLDPPKSLYEWSSKARIDRGSVVVDEVLKTSNCAVWSRNSSIKRVFTLDVEAEPLLHAFVTSFVTVPEVTSRVSSTKVETEPALIVILKTQAHIFLLSGDTHVLPLSFETNHALPLPRGFALQPKLVDAIQNEQSSDPGSPEDPRLEAGIRVRKRHQTEAPTQERTPVPRTVTKPTKFSPPRHYATYAFTEILSELSLIVFGPARKPHRLENCQVLPCEEELAYVSTSDELHNADPSRREALYIAVTINSKHSTLTVWQIVFDSSRSESTTPKDASTSVRSSEHRSSSVYTRHAGVATPVSRGPATFNESFAGMRQSLTEHALLTSSNDQNSKQGEDLVTQLGLEFEQSGVQTRSARRVSSMLARTDLGGANDRTTFNDLPLGPTGRKSLGRIGRRGESLGGFSDRQSFGRRRSSFQANNSVLSDGTSFLDIPASHFTEDGGGVQDPEIVGMNGYMQEVSQQPPEVGFMKLKSMPYHSTQTISKWNDSVRIFTVLAPDTSTADERRSRVLSICIPDRNSKTLTTINLAIKPQVTFLKTSTHLLGNDVKAIEVRQVQAVEDCCTVVEKSVQRVLTLSKTRNGQTLLHLEAPWSVSFRLDLPSNYQVFSTRSPEHADMLSKRKDTGIRRVIPAHDVGVTAFANSDGSNEILLMDKAGRSHQVRIRLLPSDDLARKVLETVNFILPPKQHDNLLVVWWEVKRWLEMQDIRYNLEWTAMTVCLFALAVPFISKVSDASSASHRRKKSGVVRSASGTAVHLEQWEGMHLGYNPYNANLGAQCISWSWMDTTASSISGNKVEAKHSRTGSRGALHERGGDGYIIRCAQLAREFLQSPAGENAMGPEGYLPTAVNKDRAQRRAVIANIVVALHLLREEQKLDLMTINTPTSSLGNLTIVIVQLAKWLDWTDWDIRPGNYYASEISQPHVWSLEDTVIDTMDVPKQQFGPPSIYLFVESCAQPEGQGFYPTLLDLVSQTRNISMTHPLYKAAVLLTPRSFALMAFLQGIKGKRQAQGIMEVFLESKIDRSALASIPDGVATIVYLVISAMRPKPRADWSLMAQKLVGREDLDKDSYRVDSKRVQLTGHNHESFRDHRTIGNNAIEADTISRWDASNELDRQTVTKLIFRDDRRFQEASKLVNQTRPPVVECNIEPGWSEGDLLEAQKELAQHVSRRTFSVSAGRGMMHFNARVPLLTERVPIPAFTPQCVIKPRGTGDSNQSMTFSADKANFTEEKTCWAFFHNGASAGLMISKDAAWIDTSWILYNKPSELTNRHAGFLLALGLNGHLKTLAKWVAFKYLTPKHTMTSVGLLLGLAASYLGTSDTLITRLLSVHVTRLLPPGAAELNLSPQTQTAGLMGIGLLYHSSQHRRMSEVMLSEIENNDAEERSGDEPILRDEGYRLAAGFSLGLINLGQGQKLHGLRDMSIVERLLTIAIGTKNVNIVHVLDRATAAAVIAVAFIFMKTNDEVLAKKIDIPDTLHQFDYVRPDMFLLRTLARHLVMWDKIKPSHDFIRHSLPQVYQKRADLRTTKRLSTDDLSFYNIVAGICFAISLRYAGSHKHDVRDLLITFLDQFWRLSKLPALNYDSKVTLNSVRNCLDVLALSCATVMAGSGDLVVLRRLRALHGRTDPETPFGSHLAAHMALGALFLGGGTATFGTSTLAIASLVIAFYPFFPTDVLDNRGHLQALRHLWVLAVEHRCLICRDFESNSIVSGIEARITLTNGQNILTKVPGLLPDLDTISYIHIEHDLYWPVDLDLSSLSNEQSTSNDVASNPRAKESRTLRDDLKSDPKNLSIMLLRRTAYEKPTNFTSTFTSELQALDEAKGVPSLDPNAPANERWKNVHAHIGTDGHRNDPFDWIFELNAFKDLDHTERALVLGSSAAGVASVESGKKLLLGTVVDSRLEFEVGTLGLDAGFAATTGRNGDVQEEGDKMTKILPGMSMQKDKLWQLRLLFAWMDRWDEDNKPEGTGEEGEEDEETSTTSTDPRWLNREVIDRLRWRVWTLANGED